MARKKALGFGFIPEETEHHFLIIIGKKGDPEVSVFERFTWREGVVSQKVEEKERKVSISRYKWNAIAEALKSEFNLRLREQNIISGKWVSGGVPVERLLGKEMVLLMWAIEDTDPAVIPNAIKNWQGLTKEERWWLFTMTNASTGHALDKKGWRKAVRYALTENPVEERATQRNLIEELFRQG